jgi:SNF2 family DNA or RNA helicase
VAPELPKVTIQKVYLESSEKLHSILRKELQASVEESKSLHRALGIVKSAAAEKLIEDDLEGGVEKIVVYTYHKDVAKALKDKFGAKAVLYTGEETITEKEEAKRLFVEDARVRIFIGQITAAGTGLDGLQAVCSTAVFVELVYAPERIRQAIGRLDRFGQTQPVTVKVLIAEDSEDEKFLDTLALKAGHIAQVYDEVGDVRFLGACCAVCNEKKELKDLRRVAGLSVCKDARCVETLEALI